MASNLNPANAVTASRFLTLPPYVWAMDHGYHQVAMLLLLLCGVLDLFDGAVARLFKCQTPFGEVFDAIADGICYGFAIIVLTAYGRVPWQAVTIILALGLLNAGFRYVYAKRAGRTTNYQSHAMERLVAFAAYLGGFGTLGFQVDLFYWTFTGLLAVVVVHDAKRMVLDPVPPPRPRVPDDLPAERDRTERKGVSRTAEVS
ncbi:MAG: CDP-alcohol phosphatidyltransferase family protein [Kofleriaceae bacterium]|nr:MAG: CDP-alcohol phosphatidyltransferase family protein [Kofleriaceae bacterium]MBZ0238523.1 CDP-alcohol phosphatidyltransferase family protein [Kofleriaceae bacterium]